MTEEENKDVNFSKEDIDKINADIESAKKSLVSETKSNEPSVNVDSLKEEITRKIKADLEAEAAKKAEEQEKARLKRELEEQKSRQISELDALKDKVNQLSESKNVIDSKSPFEGNNKSYEDIINDKELMQSIDEASRQEFFNKRGR